MKAATLFQTKPVERPLLAPKGRSEIPLATFSFLFSEFVQYSQTRIKSTTELERRLEDGGYGVGFRLLEVLISTEKGRRREIRLLDILRFVHGTLWKFLFGHPARDLEQSNTEADEYMIRDTDLFVNKYVSVPKAMGAFNCAAFVAGIVHGCLDNADFPARVTAHYTEDEGQPRAKTTILIKFEPSVLAREARLTQS